MDILNFKYPIFPNWSNFLKNMLSTWKKKLVCVKNRTVNNMFVSGDLAASEVSDIGEARRANEDVGFILAMRSLARALERHAGCLEVCMRPEDVGAMQETAKTHELQATVSSTTQTEQMMK